jgi:hypothetical protein
VHDRQTAYNGAGRVANQFPSTVARCDSDHAATGVHRRVSCTTCDSTSHALLMTLEGSLNCRPHARQRGDLLSQRRLG